MEWALYILCAVVLVGLFVHSYHQWRMKRSAYLFREAIRNKDYAFSLSVKGLWSGERAMVEMLNSMGQELKKLMAENEVESWQKLTRVLTHEIMNSTAPITSISQSLLRREDVKSTPIEDGIRAIYDTSSGLSHFVENYRKFTQLQKPNPVKVQLRSFVDGIVPMYSNLNWTLNVADSLYVNVDEGLFRQVFINLIKNAVEAGATKVGIHADVASSDGDIAISVSNNGASIPPEARRDIFTPFFSTKSTGSGIGLSLSRQIMVMQGGDLSLNERPLPSWNVSFVIKSK